MARSPQKIFCYHWLWGQLSTTFSNATEVSQWSTPSCSQHNQLRTIASETVDPIYWPLPPTLMGSTPFATRAQYNISVHPLPRIDPATFSMLGNRLPITPCSQGMSGRKLSTKFSLVVQKCTYLHCARRKCRKRRSRLRTDLEGKDLKKELIS